MNLTKKKKKVFSAALEVHAYIPALGKLSQEVLEFKASLGYSKVLFQKTETLLFKGETQAIQVQTHLAGRNRQSLGGADPEGAGLSSCCPACLKDSVLVDKAGVARGCSHVSSKRRKNPRLGIF